MLWEREVGPLGTHNYYGTATGPELHADVTLYLFLVKSACRSWSLGKKK